jgi:peptidylprolyl isomerase/peptidyl-prolyl cis-trans isomerase C
MSQDLERLGLNPESLAAAVGRDLKVEAVLDKIAADVPAVSEVDAEIYYRLHPEAFDRPEARKLRHILITYQSQEEKAKAKLTLEKLRSTRKTIENFAEAALRHSQCPTAMEGGQLGTIKRGQLYAELEPAAFSLATGEISAILESPIGLHILLCEEILPFGMLSFNEVRDRIVERLSDKRRRDVQRDWIKELLRRTPVV